MRLVSVFWGLILLLAWYFIVLKLSQNRSIALVCMALIACDYMILDTASSGRMDMMSASLGFAAIAAFLLLRERNLLLAILASQTFVVLSGLTHPNGVMAFLGLIFLTLYFDFRQIGWKHVAIAFIPYLVGGTAFGLWVLQDPTAFKDQFIDNVLMGGRTKGLTAPLEGFIKEFTKRYPHAFGLQANSGGHSGPIYLKSLILIGYITGLLGYIFTKELRRNRNYFALLVVTVIYFTFMALFDGQKETPYLVHIIPFYCAFLAIWIVYAWKNRVVPAPLLILGVGLFVALQVGGMSLRIKQNTYGNFYQPTVEFLKQNAADDELIMGGSDFGFGLGFPANHVDDGRFGFYTGKKPKFIIYDSGVEMSWQSSKEHYPQLYEHFPRLLQEYEVAYENPGYKVYRKR
jgi:hypothetical protein